MAKSFITARTFRFLAELEQHNERSWFEANKERYLGDVRDPLLAFIGALEPRLARISPYLVVDPRPAGGSLLRVHRDTRFSKDKRPYKGWAAMRFPHQEERDAAPGFYLHIEPGHIFAGAGTWRAGSEAIGRVRDAIVADPQGWKRASRGRGRALDDGERLKRPPRGYDPEHPWTEDLKRKSFTTSTTFSQKEVCAADFPSQFTKTCRQAAPLMAFLSDAVGVPW